jgi:hypothetical protein
MTSNNNDEIFYKGEKLNLGIPVTKLKDNLKEILNPSIIDKYLTKNDFRRLSKFLPNNKIQITKEFLQNILTPKKLSDTFLHKHPLQLFQTMLNRNYFTKNYQHHLEELKLNGIEEYINLYEKTYHHIQKNLDKYSSQLSLLTSREYEKTTIAETYHRDRDYNQYNINFDNNEVIFETNSYLASSGYTTLNSEEEKESQINETFKEHTIENELFVKAVDNESGMEGSLSDERFKNLKMNKNQLTIKPRTREEIKEFQRQELERYKFPHLPWAYNNSDGSVSVVSPVQKKIPTGTASKPRDHVMLKSDRPAYVTILCLVRDAGSRLPEGVGTRADICDLLKDSQYINERLSDSQVKYYI